MAYSKKYAKKEPKLAPVIECYFCGKKDREVMRYEMIGKEFEDGKAYSCRKCFYDRYLEIKDE